MPLASCKQSTEPKDKNTINQRRAKTITYSETEQKTNQ